MRAAHQVYEDDHNRIDRPLDENHPEVLIKS
jgi:hypothetical protein